MNDMLAQVDYWPGSLVERKQTLDVLQDGISTVVPYTHLILATGATDRVPPFPAGWTPGAHNLGDRASLSSRAAPSGRAWCPWHRPLPYLVAYQHARAGAQVAAVLDTSRFTDHGGALACCAPGLLAKGLYMAWLRACSAAA